MLQRPPPTAPEGASIACDYLKKTSKTPLVMAEVYRPDVLSFRPVLKSELFAQPASTSRFSAKTQPSQRQKT